MYCIILAPLALIVLMLSQHHKCNEDIVFLSHTRKLYCFWDSVWKVLLGGEESCWLLRQDVSVSVRSFRSGRVEAEISMFAKLEAINNKWLLLLVSCFIFRAS